MAEENEGRRGAGAPEQEPQEPGAGQERKPETEPEPQEPDDRRGNPGVNCEKYRRDIESRDAKIAELEGKLAEAAKTEEGRAELKKQLDEVRAEADAAKVDLELERAGCTDRRKSDAARALLGAYGGDVAKLKAEHPYLFEQPGRSGSTGGRPAGPPDAELDARLDRAFGLKKK